jgi:hypothetical protein
MVISSYELDNLALDMMNEEESMYQIIYEKLVQLARSGNVITYGELAGLVHLQMESLADRNQLSHNLDQINRQEHNQGHPMISAVVVYADKNGPGDGFSNLGTELGLYGGSHSKNDKLTFWTSELKKVYDFWRDQP